MVKNKYELSLMRQSGKIAAQALKEVLENVRAGVTGLELDHIAEGTIKRLGGQISFKSVPGYRWASCITINEQVVHGIPTGREIREGDLVSIDLGSVYKGWHTDCAWTVLVEDGKSKIDREEKSRFLKAGEEALWDGINQAVAGRRVGDISQAIQSKIERVGYYVVRSLVGHGIGKSLHEEPEIPGYGQKDTGLVLKEGMTLAIEVIYTEGTSEVVLAKDGWTFFSADGSLAGLFEMTAAVGKKQSYVLTDWRKV